MAKATHYICDGENFKGIVWETKIGRIITTEGKISPQMGFTVCDIQTGENLISSDMIDVLTEILPFE